MAGRRVIVVDDHAERAQQLVSVSRAAGLECDGIAASVDAAVIVCAMKKPDAVLINGLTGDGAVRLALNLKVSKVPAILIAEDVEVPPSLQGLQRLPSSIAPNELLNRLTVAIL
jgi:DNA-binding response OmpR family regulator